MQLILYSKPGCHLCDGLRVKLKQIQDVDFDLEIRDITTREDWFRAYQYEIPVLCYQQADQREQPLPRLSPRASIQQVSKMLKKIPGIEKKL